MITIKLLGGAKKAVGKDSVVLDKSDVSVAEILSFLQGISKEPRLLQPNNLLIAINGIESTSRADASVTSGDTVTVVTVVHGGTL